MSSTSKLFMTAASLFLIQLAVAAHAAVVTVDSLDDPGDGDCSTNGCTLREAVAAAADGDEIVFNAPVGAGDTITLSGTHILIDKSLTIDGDPGFIIDANSASRIFRIAGIDERVVVIRNLVFENGSEQIGGAIRNNENLTLTGVQFLNNKAVSQGGAIHSEGGFELVVEDSTFTGNEVFDPDELSTTGGGAIHSFSALTLRGVTFDSNHARSGKSGGAVDFSASGNELTMERFFPDSGGIRVTNFKDNTADRHGGAVEISSAEKATGSFVRFERNQALMDGGAIHAGSGIGELRFSASSFLENSATDGGAIHASSPLVILVTKMNGNQAATEGGALWHGTPTSSLLLNSVMLGNSADRGGAVYNDDGGSLSMENMTISGNSVTFTGGGVFNRDGVVTLKNVTVFDNQAGNGGESLNSASGATIELVNTILAGANDQCIGTGDIISLGHNIDSSSSCGLTEPGDLSATDPRLEPLQNNGGNPAESHHPMIDSPAIDGGTNDPCPSSDQRGSSIAFPRPLDGNSDGQAVCDIGAIESNRLLFRDRFEMR